MEIVLISDGPLPKESPVRKLPFFFPARLSEMCKVTPRTVGEARVAIIELADTSETGLSALRSSWESISAIPVICLTDRSTRRDAIQAAALGKAVVMDRETPLAVMLKKIRQLAGPESEEVLPEDVPEETAKAFHRCNAFLESMCFSAIEGSKIQTGEMKAGAGELLAALSIHGLSPWLEAVHAHHSATYRHSLTVAGYAGAFALHLGLSETDCQEAIAGGLIHDIGKMRIPLTILDKAEKLTEQERAVMDRHPEYSREILKPRLEVPVDIKKMAIQHHEYLDGSGYPDGLKADRISKKVRMITICDIFVALTEIRAYKASQSPREAIMTMKDMGPKLDQDLLLEFGRMLLARQFCEVGRKSSAA